MTYKEWLNRTVARFGISNADAELILANQAGIIPDPDADVDVRVAKTVLAKSSALLFRWRMSAKAAIL